MLFFYWGELFMANINAVIYQKKRHPFLKFLLVLFIIILILIGLPIALLYIFVYDAGTKTVWRNNDISSEKYTEVLSSNIVSQSIDNTSNDGKMTIALKDDDINTFISYALDSLNPTVKSYVPSAYFDFVSNQYNLYVNAETPFFPHFKTRIRLIANVNSIPEPDKGFELKIVDAKIGRIGGLLNLVDQFVTADMINGVLSSSGMHFDVDWANHSIKYTLANMLADFGLSGSSDSFFTEIINDVFTTNQGTITTDFSSDHSIKFAIDLSSAHNEATPITTFAKTISAVREEFKNASEIDLNTVSQRFSEIADENGEKPVKGKDLQDCLEEHADEVSKTTYITNGEITDFLRGSDLIGTAYPFVYEDLKTNTKRINFIVINDFTANILEGNKISFAINISVNGYNTKVEISGNIAEKITRNKNGKLALNFEMTGIKYGNIAYLWNEDKDEPKQIINSMIQEAFTSGSDDVVISGKTISVIINNSIYDLGNEINTENGKLTVQVFMPKFYSGSEAVNVKFPSNDGLMDGDRYFCTTNDYLYTFNGSSWDSGIDVMNPAFLLDPANSDLIDFLVSEGLIELP